MKQKPFKLKVEGQFSISKLSFYLKLFSFSIVTIALILISRKNNYASFVFLNENSFINSFFALPDSIPPDSTDIQEGYITGDTLDMYVIGADTVYVIYEDTSYTEEMRDGDANAFKIFLSPDIYTVKEGLLGLNITDLFEIGHANEFEDLSNYPVGENPWDYLSELCPQTLRVFSGQGSRFMELFGSPKSIDDPSNLTGTMWNGGYGFSIQRIIPFYDKTDGFPNNAPPLFDATPGALPYDCLYDDLTSDGNLNIFTSWLDGQFIGTFEDYFHKWNEQPSFDPTNPDEDTHEEQDLYINQLIDLINKIETENPGHYVSVILCLNILSETATNCHDLVVYLQNEGITVDGIEIGNEVYFKWGADMMGFDNHGDVSAFIHYWDYINGFNYTEGSIGTDEDDGIGGMGDHGIYNGTDFVLDDVLPADVLVDHDYIGAFKSDPNTAGVKIGLPAHNLANCGEYVFISDPGDEGTSGNLTPPPPCPDCNYPGWNTELATKYDKQLSGIYKFNAVILHPYYTPINVPSVNISNCNTNWLGIAEYLEAGLTPTTPWLYSSYDERLRRGFDGFMGFPVRDTDFDGIWDSPANGNLRQFVTNGLKEAMDAHKTPLKFTTADVGPETKEIWYTEYNVNTTDNVPDADVNYVNSMLNTFAHAEGLWNWILWNIKSNAGISYRPDYFTIATLQSYLSGTSIGLLNNIDQDEQVILNRLSICTGLPPVTCSTDKDCLEKDYYMRRLTYFAMDLLNTISNEHLSYLRTMSIAIFPGSTMYNISPTVFYNNDEEDPKLYVFYTNIKSVEQVFNFNPGLFYQLFSDATSTHLYGGTINFMNAELPYSTSGKSTLYDINNWYNCEQGGGTQMHTIELTESDMLDGLANTDCPVGATGAACVKVPPYSLGYFTLNVDVSFRFGQATDIFALYPNPSSTSFYIQQKNPDNTNQLFMSVEIYNLYGALIKSSEIYEGQAIDIANLPVGVYNVVIKCEGLQTETQRLIKMK